LNATARSLTPIRIAYAALGSGSAPVWCAKEAGIFADEGLDAEVVLIRGSGNVAAELLSNQVQFANIAAPLAVSANLKDGDLVYLTGGINWLIQSIIARREVESPAQLRGRKFGVSRSGGVDDVIVDYLLSADGIHLAKDLKHVSIDNQPDAITKLDSGEIDAALFSPPYCFEAVKHRHHVLIDAADLRIDYQLGGIVARRSYIEGHSETASAVVRAYVRGIHRYKTDAALALDVLRKYSLIDDGAVARQCYETANRYFQCKPYPTTAGLHRVICQIAGKNPGAKHLSVEEMTACGFLAALDNSGFIDELYFGGKMATGGDTVSVLTQALETASRTKRGQLAISGHDEDFQLEIEGETPIHVEIRGGQLAVHSGPSPRQEPLHFTRVQFNRETLSSILEGRMSPVEAMEQGKLFLRTRLYGGALITILLRAAYDLARKRRLRAEA
jgi:ABC-type nitrate/sulfonate/bicarbonate transport system substrate-binding protein